MNKVTKDTIIEDVLDIDETTSEIFLDIGMHCLGCPSARAETIAEACEVHGIDVDVLLEEINEYIELNQKEIEEN